MVNTRKKVYKSKISKIETAKLITSRNGNVESSKDTKTIERQQLKETKRKRLKGEKENAQVLLATNKGSSNDKVTTLDPIPIVRLTRNINVESLRNSNKNQLEFETKRKTVNNSNKLKHDDIGQGNIIGSKKDKSTGVIRKSSRAVKANTNYNDYLLTGTKEIANKNKNVKKSVRIDLNPKVILTTSTPKMNSKLRKTISGDNSIDTKKELKVMLHKLGITSPTVELRQRKNASLAIESSSLDESLLPNNSIKIPIYRQPIIAEMKRRKPKKNEDLYKFEPEFPDDEPTTKRKQKKRGKRKEHNKSSEEYNAKVENILRNAMAKIKKRNEDKKKKLEDVEPMVSTCSSPMSAPPSSPLPALNEEKTVKIKILDNIQLVPPGGIVETPGNFNKSNPKAHSSLIEQQHSVTLTPWRYNNVNVRRTPYFVKLKKSALPSISQEMVLDHSIVNKFDDTTRMSSVRELSSDHNDSIPKKPSTTQTTLTDFLEEGDTVKENPSKTPNRVVSLFDIDDFSPIKKAATTPGRTRSSSNYLIERKILTSKNEPNNQQNTDDDDDEKDETYFGFLSDDENEHVPSAVVEAKPFRFSTNLVTKKYQRKPAAIEKSRVKKQLEMTAKINQLMDEPEINSDESSENLEESDVESLDGGGVGLFEDVAVAEHLTEKELRRRQRKIRWIPTEKNDGINRKRKDVWTKEEEAEAEKWAANFNSMCEEVEAFPLEIE